MADAVMGVHEFRAAVSDLLEAFRRDPDAEPVAVGAYRREEAVLVPVARYRALVASAPPAEVDTADLPAIRAQLARTPDERLAGLRNAADFFAAARPAE